MLQTNNFNAPPYAPANAEGTNNLSSSIPTGQVLQLVLKDENGMPLNKSSNETAPASHVFMSRENPPAPLVSFGPAAKLKDAMNPHLVSSKD